VSGDNIYFKTKKHHTFDDKKKRFLKW